MSSQPNGRHRVNNADIHDRTLALENQVGNLGEKVREISESQNRMAADSRMAFQQLEAQQRRSQENMEKMLSNSQEKLNSAINTRDVDQAGNKKFTITIATMAAGICMTAMVAITTGIVGVGWFSIRSLVDGVAVPMRSDLSRLENSVGRNSADLAMDSQKVNTLIVKSTTSEVDREDMRNRLAKAESMITQEIAARHSGFSALQQQLTEAERQHTMQDISRNMIHENTMSHLKMLFEKMGLPQPASPSYFPKIGREINTPIPNE